MATVKEVAQRAGVSLGTVSNVLNRPEVVSEALRTRVQDAIAELGFVRNESARQLRAGVSRTIAMVVLDVANPFFTDVIAGAEELAERHDALVVMCNIGEERCLGHHCFGNTRQLLNEWRNRAFGIEQRTERIDDALPIMAKNSYFRKSGWAFDAARCFNVDDAIHR